MALIDIDFTIPIALIASAIVGVVLVRAAASRGKERAKVRTQRLIRDFSGMQDGDRASSE